MGFHITLHGIYKLKKLFRFLAPEIVNEMSIAWIVTNERHTNISTEKRTVNRWFFIL